MKAALLTLSLILTTTASFGNPLCIDKIPGKFSPLDLVVKKTPQGISQKKPFYFQNGSALGTEAAIPNKKSPYCEVNYTAYDLKPFSKIWGKGAIQNLRIHALGDGEVSLSPRPNSNWVAVTYDCKNIRTYDDLKNALNPTVEVSCDDWGDLLPGGKKNPNCDPKPAK